MIRFRALGALGLTGPDGKELQSALAQPKRVALLAYLAMAAPGGLHRRDKLLGIFWPDSDQEHASGALRQALRFLRRELGNDVLVSRADGDVGLSAEGFWCDAIAFETLLDQGQAYEALELYQGDLLESFYISGAPEFEHWLDATQMRLRWRASDAAWELAEQSEAEGEGLAAKRWARRAAALTPDDENTLRRLVYLLDRVGDRTDALRAYEAFASRLAEEDDIEPSPETQHLINNIRSRVESSPQFVTPRPFSVVKLDDGVELDDPVELDDVVELDHAVGIDTLPMKARRRPTVVSYVGALAAPVILILMLEVVRLLVAPGYEVEEPQVPVAREAERTLPELTSACDGPYALWCNNR